MDRQFNKPNSWGLQGSDFDFDLESYTVALGFLGDVSIGVPEEPALVNNGGNQAMMRAWQASHRFRREFGKAREMGEAERRYAEQKTARANDPFGLPPRGGVDLAAAEYDPQAEKPRGGLAGWLRRIGVIADRQAQRDEPATHPPGGKFTAIADLTPQQARAIAQQKAEELQRAQAERESPTTEGPAAQGQKWDQKKEWMSPDGTAWQGAPGSGGGLFTAHGNPDSFPMP